MRLDPLRACFGGRSLLEEILSFCICLYLRKFENTMFWPEAAASDKRQWFIQIHSRACCMARMFVSEFESSF